MRKPNAYRRLSRFFLPACLLPALFVLALPPVAGAEAKDPEQTDSKARIDEINNDLRKLSEEIRELQNKRDAARSELDTIASEMRRNQPLAGLVEVQKAFLPPSPTRQECEAYLDQLRSAVENRRRISSSHLCVEKLKAVPKEHLDLLIDERSENTRLGSYVRYVIDEEDHAAVRKRITETLDRYPHNIHLVVTHGWCQDIKEHLKHLVLEGEMPEDPQTAKWFFQAAVELADPALYKRMHEITVQSPQWEHHLLLLRSLPDYDLNHTLNVCLRPKGDEPMQPHPIEIDFMDLHHRVNRIGELNEQTVLLAAESGHIDSLAALIGAIQDTERNILSMRWNAAHPRMRALRYIRFRGSNQEIKDWFDTHRDDLVFDNLTKQYVLPNHP